jgi:hypothetical protein
MGAGASALGNQTARNLARDMLNGIYANTNMMQFMELSKRSSCSKFAFDFKESLLKHMKEVQLYPVRGEKGLVAVLSIDEIAPTKAGTPDMARLIKQRDEFCVDAGYIYVSIFQIYFALSLNLFDASTVRTVMRGGSITKTALGDSKFTRAESSLLAPFIILKEVTSTGETSSPFANIPLARNTSLSFSINEVLDRDTEANVEAEYKKQGSREGEKKIISLKKTLEDKYVNITLSVQDTFIAIFSQRKDNKSWTYSLDADSSEFTSLEKTTVNTELLKKISAVCEGSGSNSGPAPSTTTTSSVATGSSMYIGYEKTRDILQKAQAGKVDYPIAYAIGRALTVMYPIDKKDATVSNQRVTQICKKSLDFERNGSYLPKEGGPIKDNIYYGSLLGLYYDTYTIKADKIEFTKSEGGRISLDEASTDLYKLYTNKSEPSPGFIEKGNFRKLDEICQNPSTMVLSPQLGTILFEQVVKNLVTLQQKYTVDAEKLIQKLFKIEITNLPDRTKAVSIDFSPTILKAGRMELDKIRLEARKLLLDYYMKADSYFFSAVQLIRNNPTGIRPV